MAGVGGMGIVGVTGLDHVLPSGAGVWGGLRAVLGDGVCQADTGEDRVSALEAALSGVPSAVTEAPMSVLCVVPAGTAGEVELPAQVPLVNAMGEGAAEVILAGVLVKARVTVSADEFFSESSVSLRTGYRGCWGAAWLSHKDQEEIHTSTRAAHILWVCGEQG